ncbi:MAG: transporter [Pyrinomonadaceae bacterium]
MNETSMYAERIFIAALIFLALAGNSVAQEDLPIQDNSFLLEEAYNQEAGVIQHISTFTRSRGGKWLYTFTEEIPVKSQIHQFSITLPVQNAGDGSGLGDLALNYRYQLISNHKLAIAPRFSVLIPTGNFRKERGLGGVAIQFNLPVSYQFAKRFVTHANAGFTFTPRAKNVLGERARAVDYNLGQSIVWLTAPRFNVLVEAVWNNTAAVTVVRQSRRENEVLINPGIRWAHNFKNGLQIVPGVAFPIGVGPSRGERGVFFYLSFEHPFGKKSE